jgi:membrane-associated protein
MAPLRGIRRRAVLPKSRGDDSLTDMSMISAALAHVPALGPDMLEILTPYGTVGFWIVVAIIFAECGLLIGFFLPGDSLLFITGILIATSIIDLNIWLAAGILIIAAITGNLVGYWVGLKAGPALFNKPDSKLFKKEYVTKTHAFFEKYGARAIILARFVPIVRTFITAIAGVGTMNFRKYAGFSIIGAFLWAGAITVAGYYLGNITFIKDNLEVILVAIVAVSIIPIIIEAIKHRRQIEHLAEDN